MEIWKDENTNLEWLYDDWLLSQYHELEHNIENHENEGWRVPTIEEVKTILDFFPFNLQLVWCSDEVSADMPGKAWCMCFNDKNIYNSSVGNKRNTIYVRNYGSR